RETPATGQGPQPLHGRDLAPAAQFAESAEIQSQEQPTHAPDGWHFRHRPARRVVESQQRNVETRARDELLTRDRAHVDLHQHEATVARVAAKLDRGGAAMAGDLQQAQAERGDLGLLRDVLGAAVADPERILPDLALGAPADRPAV